jgi:hypothetical protein
MSNYEISLKKLPMHIYVFGASQTTTDRFSKELKLTDISGLPDYQDTLEKVYEMLEHILEVDDKNIETTIIASEAPTCNPNDSDGEAPVSKSIDNVLTCTFKHKLYGFKIQFTLDKISDGIIIYDVKAEKRIKQLEKQLNGVMFLPNGTYAIPLDTTEISINPFSTRALNVSTYSIENLSLLNKLTKLNIIHNPDVMYNPKIHRYMEISNLDDLKDIKTLTHITIRNFHNITDLSPLSGLSELVELDLTGCKGIVDVSPLANLAKLCKLVLTGTSVVNALSLKHLPNLAITS